MLVVTEIVFYILPVFNISNTQFSRKPKLRYTIHVTVKAQKICKITQKPVIPFCSYLYIVFLIVPSKYCITLVTCIFCIALYLYLYGVFTYSLVVNEHTVFFFVLSSVIGIRFYLLLYTVSYTTADL